MDKKQFVFTKDYMAAIAQTGIFTYQRDERVITPNDVLLGVWKFTQKHEFHALFWKFL